MILTANSTEYINTQSERHTQPVRCTPVWYCDQWPRQTAGRQVVARKTCVIPDTSESLVKMASALQPPRLAVAVKKNSGGAGWKYFAYEADDQGRAKDRPVRKQWLQSGVDEARRQIELVEASIL